MLLVVTLERHGHRQHRLAQQAAFRAHLIGRHRLQFRAKSGIEDAHIGLKLLGAHLGTGGQRVVPAE